MAKIADRPAFLKQYIKEVTRILHGLGVTAKIGTQHIPFTKLHRVVVLSPQFQGLKPSERQSLVWRIADQTLTPEQKIRISMILTLTPQEFTGAKPRAKQRVRAAN